MSQSQVISNTWMNGLRIDNDRNIQPNSSYRYALGMRLLYNRSDNVDNTLTEDINDGASAAMCTARGTKIAFYLCPGYEPIGSIDTKKGTVIFSTNGVNSEIGVLDTNNNVHSAGFAEYTTLFNDRLDPNGDLLRLSKEHYINGFYVSENEDIDRVYFTDGLNQRRVININLFYENGVTIHPKENGCSASVEYPKHMSSHAFDERMDLVFPRLKFVQRIVGQLKSGQYQIVVKYGSKTGHTSVWSHDSRPVYVTDQKLDGTVRSVPNAYKTNHHNRVMGASNIMTEEGLRFEIKGVDTRWDYLHIGYIYHASSVAFQEAIEWKRIEIGNSTTITVDMVGHTGTSITKDELNRINQTILSVGTTQEQDNRRWDGDLELLPEIKLGLDEVTITPTFKYFRADMTQEPVFAAVPNPITGRDDNDPITNSTVNDGGYLISNFTGSDEYYQVVDDYMSYKGQQVSSLLPGFFRGETYPFAVVLIDRKGNPLFAQHIKDFTFPNMSDGDQFTLSRQSGSEYDLRAMGAIFSGIKIPASVIRDKFGKLNISGIMIVRTKRIASIATQGVIFNTINTINGETATEQDRFVQPQLWVHSQYNLPSLNSEFPKSFRYLNVNGSVYKDKQDPNFWNGNDSAPYPAVSTAYYFNFHSPDILIDRKITDKMLAGRIQIEGLYHKSWSEWVNLTADKKHVYTKSYRSLPRTNFSYDAAVIKGRAAIGDTSRIGLAILHNQSVFSIYEKFDPERANIFDYRANVWMKFARDQVGVPLPIFNPFPNSPAISSFQEPGSVILKLMDIAAVDHIESGTSKTTNTIANWKITPDEYYNQDSETSLETRRYFSTGHYQPITEDVLNQLVPNFDSNGEIESYTMNDVEVWGGDCYVNLFDFTRLYPEYSDCKMYGDNPNRDYPDYSVSHIVPIESKYNLSLLFGRRFAKNGINPQRASCTDQLDRMVDGIMTDQPEDWSYNEVLLLEEATKFYFPKPHDVNILSNIETGVAWSPTKIYGETEDSYRIQLPGDIGFAEGAYGKIQGFTRAFDGLYVVQETGFGFIKTRQRSMIPTDDGSEITVKSGDVFAGVDYISRQYGTQHKNSIWSLGNTVGFVDARKGRILTFSQAGLSRESEQDNVDDAASKLTLYFDKPISHGENFVDIVSGIDEENSEAWTSFIHNRDYDPVGSPYDRVREVGERTLVYNARMGYYVGWMPVSPRIYINSGRFLLTPNPKLPQEVHLHNYGKYGHWYGEYIDSVLQFVVNPQPDTSKVYDNGIVTVNQEGWGRIKNILHESSSDNHNIIFAQNTGTSIIRVDDRPIWFEDLLRYPMHEYDWDGVKLRLRGKTLQVTIVIDNSQQEVDDRDARVVITSFSTKFRISNPVQY